MWGRRNLVSSARVWLSWGFEERVLLACASSRSSGRVQLTEQTELFTAGETGKIKLTVLNVLSN